MTVFFSQRVFTMAVFKGVYFHLKKMVLSNILFEVKYLLMHHDDIAFILTAVEESLSNLE